jgi:hypothetical protein
MIRRQILAALLVVVSLAVTIPCVAQQSPIEKEIRDLEDKMNAAYAANDLPVYFAYYADDFTQWLPEGRTDLPQYNKEWTAFIRSGGKIESAQPFGHEDTNRPLVQARWKVEGRAFALFTRPQEEVISRQRLRRTYYERLP